MVYKRVFNAANCFQRWLAGFIQVQQFLVYLFIDNVKSEHIYVVWQTNDPNDTRLFGGSGIPKKQQPVLLG